MAPISQRQIDARTRAERETWIRDMPDGLGWFIRLSQGSGFDMNQGYHRLMHSVLSERPKIPAESMKRLHSSP